MLPRSRHDSCMADRLMKPTEEKPDARVVLTREQCREARRLLSLSTQALSRRADIKPATIESFEEGRTIANFPTRAKLRGALQSAGAQFSSDESPGVRLRTPASIELERVSRLID